MPIIYLSPSTQDWNMYVTGSGSEEYNMNLLADALVPYLLSKEGICNDYTNPQDLLSAFTFYKKTSGIRTPSYTDRILYHILPGYESCLKQE